MDISRRKSEWIGVQESKVRESCNIWHLSSIVHPPQGNSGTQDCACCFEAHLNVHNVCSSIYACGGKVGVDCKGMQRFLQWC